MPQPTPLWRDPLFSPGDRFPLGPPRGVMDNCQEGPSGPATRPFSLRHVVAGAHLAEVSKLRWNTATKGRSPWCMTKTAR